MSVKAIEVLQTKLPGVFESGATTNINDEWAVIELENPDAPELDELWNVDELNFGDQWEMWGSGVDLGSDLIGVDGEAVPGGPVGWGREAEASGSASTSPPPDCFAFYLPFHRYYPDRWGIYLFVEGVAQLATYLRWLTSPGATLPDSLVAARKFLVGHEMFHHQVEAFATRLEVAWRLPVYLRAGVEYYQHTAHTDDWLEEALANANGLRALDPKRRWSTVTELRAAKKPVDLIHAAAEFVRGNPPGYRRGVEYWSGGDFDSGRDELAERLHQWPRRGPIPGSPELWSLLPHRFSPIARTTVPVRYLIRRNSAMATQLKTDARYLRYRDVEKRLLALGCRLARPGKGSHQMFEGPNGAKAPVPRHPGDIKPGTVRGIVKELGIDPQAFASA